MEIAPFYFWSIYFQCTFSVQFVYGGKWIAQKKEKCKKWTLISIKKSVQHKKRGEGMEKNRGMKQQREKC